MHLDCKSCGSVEPKLSKSGPHIMARCPQCGEFIKFVSKKELKEEPLEQDEIKLMLDVIIERLDEIYRMVKNDQT